MANARVFVNGCFIIRVFNPMCLPEVEMVKVKHRRRDSDRYDGKDW